MRKGLTAAITSALVLGVTGAAFANPFADVPQNHWSYDAVASLAKAGIIDGYGDGTFRGDRQITRYEMAQMVAKAMYHSDKANQEQKAMIDKLAQEYSQELENLGVRVDNLEKKTDHFGKIGFSGDVRFRYDDLENGAAEGKDRFRFNMRADVNDDISFYARYIFNDGGFNGDSNHLSDLNMTHRGLIKNTDVTLGRYSLTMGASGYLTDSTGDVEGIMTNSKWNNTGLILGYGRMYNSADYGATPTKVRDDNGNIVTDGTDPADVFFAEINQKFGKAKVYLDYMKTSDHATAWNTDNEYFKQDTFGVGATYRFDHNWKLMADYYTNSAYEDLNSGDNAKALIARVSYKGANPANPNTWGLDFEYAKVDQGTFLPGLTGPMYKMDGSQIGANGLKGYNVTLSYALAKNLLFTGIYQFDLEGTKDVNGSKDALSSNYTRVQLDYYF